MYKNTKIQWNQITVETNPFIEALGVLFDLAEYVGNIPRHNEIYKKEIQTYFGAYKRHAAVTFTQKILQENMYVRYNAPIEIMLHAYARKPLSKQFYQEHAISKRQTGTWIKLVKAFMRDSHFATFFNQHADYFMKNAQTYVQTLSLYSPQTFLFSFLGKHSNHLHVLCMHGVTTSNYGIRVGKQLYCCIRPYKETRFANQVDFACNLPYSTSLLLHEFAHSFINPLTHRYHKYLASISPTQFASIFEKQTYGTHIETAINESIIRAIECLYIQKYFTPQESEDFLQNYIQEGFTNLPKLMHAFTSEYLPNRQTYKTIKDFYPRLLTILLQV